MSGFLTGVVLITTPTGVRVDLPAADGTSYQPIQLMLGAGLSGTTVSRTSGVTQVLLTSTGELPALTESGQGFAGSGGFVNLGVTSRGIRGGRDDATQATLLGWDGVTYAETLGGVGVASVSLSIGAASIFGVATAPAPLSLPAPRAAISIVFDPDAPAAGLLFLPSLTGAGTDLTVRGQDAFDNGATPTAGGPVRLVSGDGKQGGDPGDVSLSSGAGVDFAVGHGDTGVLEVGADDPTRATVKINGKTQTTVGAAGGASALPATPLVYVRAFVSDGMGGQTEVVIPAYLPS